jgi:hypothetical protein
MIYHFIRGRPSPLAVYKHYKHTMYNGEYVILKLGLPRMKWYIIILVSRRHFLRGGFVQWTPGAILNNKRCVAEQHSHTSDSNILPCVTRLPRTATGIIFHEHRLLPSAFRLPISWTGGCRRHFLRGGFVQWTPGAILNNKRCVAEQH